mmetsp:Transcript_26506/g.84346  ORF Transcript_26506/g.84346 Transcript_26506/m.84346 type:complete len:324 (-) Transcript_26506:768-1739(-)
MISSSSSASSVSFFLASSSLSSAFSPLAPASDPLFLRAAARSRTRVDSAPISSPNTWPKRMFGLALSTRSTWWRSCTTSRQSGGGMCSSMPVRMSNSAEMRCMMLGITLRGPSGSCMPTSLRIFCTVSTLLTPFLPRRAMSSRKRSWISFGVRTSTVDWAASASARACSLASFLASALAALPLKSFSFSSPVRRFWPPAVGTRFTHLARPVSSAPSSSLSLESESDQSPFSAPDSLSQAGSAEALLALELPEELLDEDEDEESLSEPESESLSESLSDSEESLSCTLVTSSPSSLTSFGTRARRRVKALLFVLLSLDTAALSP